MKNKLCFKVFDRTLRDIIKIEKEINGKKSFGGKVIVLGGDFRKFHMLSKRDLDIML